MFFNKKIIQLSTNFFMYKNFHKYHKLQIHEMVTKHLPDMTETDIKNLIDLKSMRKNLKHRKSVANIEKVQEILQKLDNKTCDSQNHKSNLIKELKVELLKFPNTTHPSVENLSAPVELAKFNNPPSFDDFEPKEFSEIAKWLNILRTDHLGNFCGHKSYYLMGFLAELEHALIEYALEQLKPEFHLVAVPDILPAEIIQGCGMQTDGDRTQVYELRNLQKCLSGTSEMALAGYFNNKILNESDLPIKLSAVSRCFRAETSGLHNEKGIYRVHQFTKVEMFSVCTEEQSDAVLEYIKNIETNFFKKLGLHFKLLDMPPSELGAPAYRKYDIEAWMPGRKMWGEISSCSNCTDYQSRRLNIRYKMKNGDIKYVHTVNGTAAAIPRLLIAIIESFQNLKEKHIDIPDVLRKYLRGQTKIIKNKILPELKLVKHIEKQTGSD